MGAGSPGGPGGDSVIMDNGIVQGHAYAILQIASFEDQLLIQLRNPHGKTGDTAEWNGDWSDQSNKWTNRAKAQLQYDPEQEKDIPDGIFWMAVEDFLNNFNQIFACRTLRPIDGYTMKEIPGEWKGKSAAGYGPSSKRLNDFPQYRLTINRPCSAFISLK